MVHARARARVAGLLVVVTASAAVVTSGSVVAATVAKPAAVLAAATTVTLVTGDVVTLGGPGGVDVVAARGREHVGFRTRTDGDGDVHVIPTDALSLVASGRLDPRLFDVTQLARVGYGDADRADLPLIVDYPGATPRAARGARAVRELPSVSAVAMRAEKSPAFWATARTAANRIWLDGPVKASLANSVPQIGAPAAWAAGHTGAGTTVAILDSGIDTTHPDLDDAVTESRDFTESESGVDDRYGHGTHVASIVTGDGEVNKGVAPDAKLLNGKVLNDFGGGLESRYIAAMEWAAPRADVVNMSLGDPWPSDGTDPVSLAINRLTEETGALFVVAAGNFGEGRISSPGAADAALTVGAVDREDNLAGFSATGPRSGDGAIKPDITAPGVDIVAAKAAHGRIGTPAGDGYVSLSGTSMATPHVAGAAAILAGQHPDWTAGQLKSMLMSTARPNPELSAFQQGAGRVDVAAADTSALSSAPMSLHLGTALWPHQDDQPIAKTVTYTNSGTEPVTLDVTAEMTDPARTPAPAGMFTASPAQVTVPAGGTAQVTLTADTRVEGPDGVYSGTLVATGGGAAARTPVVVQREVESYDVTLNFLDHEGKPTPQYSFVFSNHATYAEYRNHDESGTVDARLPKGTYFFDGSIETSGRQAYLVEPAIAVTGPAELTFDARDGVPIGFAVEHPEARPGTATVMFAMTMESGFAAASFFGSNFDDVTALPSRTSAPGAFEIQLQAQLARPDGTGAGNEFHASPYLYHLSHVDGSGGVPADMIYEIDVRGLAKVVSSHAVATPGMMGFREQFVTMPLPHTLTEYYTPDTDWLPNFSEISSWEDPRFGLFSYVLTPRRYEPGQRTTQRWNTGVFGPGFASGADFTRRGDDLLANLGMYSDQNVGVHGVSDNAVGTTQLVRDGDVIAEEPEVGSFLVRLPAEEATYTLRTTATQPGPLSSRIDAEWTFRSAHTEEPTPVPALAVRFAPDLDDHNAAPAGKKFRFPVHVQRNGAESPGQVSAPTVEISYDDGVTWQPVRLTSHRGQWKAEVNHPRNAKFASLRWSVSDPDGNTAKATIIHAYALK